MEDGVPTSGVWQWTISIITGVVGEAFQRYLLILNIITVASAIVFSIPVIALGLIVFLFIDSIAFFQSICAHPPVPTPPIATSSTNNSVEEVPQTYTDPPFADESLKIYTLPNTLRFIASPLDIDDVSTPLAYEVTIGQSVKQDDATSRVEVAPTGRVLGEVIGTYVDNVTVLLKMEDWFTESGTFEMGRWRVEQVQAGDELGMEVAVLE
ncbi:hypothetical protein HO133_007651 [Letharia lupina]|uniref:Uncharacterized protein n=1 Tax=Letharia lupina TaxID=560253 RepID=A0A8H6CQV6_9LECA|nr:uncharacterized protein HO133_007651 [Letharia lupina]KAF6227923.1 hypothetical protein HO133_007651 [Letharia lupina]